MNQELEKAIDLRKNGEYKESIKYLQTLVERYPHIGLLYYQCAWNYDLLGEESAAVPFYEKAIQLGLPTDELQGALLGLGSTYRTLGEYEQSKKTFEIGLRLFPNHKAMQTFYSLTLYNLNEHHESMGLLLNCLLDTTTDENLLKYKRALSFYAKDLDKVWDQ